MQNTFNIHKLSSDIGLKLVWDVVGNSPMGHAMGLNRIRNNNRAGHWGVGIESVRDLGAS